MAQVEEVVHYLLCQLSQFLDVSPALHVGRNCLLMWSNTDVYALVATLQRLKTLLLRSIPPQSWALWVCRCTCLALPLVWTRRNSERTIESD